MRNLLQGVKLMIIAAALGLLLGIANQAVAKPLKVFILAGQSNMEGPAHIKTVKGIEDDPATKGVEWYQSRGPRVRSEAGLRACRLRLASSLERHTSPH